MSTTVTTSLNPWGSVSQTQRVRAYRGGRVCARLGCGTILSMYNPSAYCSVHAEMARPGRRSGGLDPLREAACEHCGASFETRNTQRKYCSDRCRMAAFARRKRAAQRAEARVLHLGLQNAATTGPTRVGDAA